MDVLMCSDVPTQMAIASLLRVAGVRPTTGAGTLSLTFVTLLSFFDTIVLIGLMFGLLRARGEHPREVWLGRPRLLRDVAWGLASVPVLFVVVGMLMVTLRVAIPSIHNVARNPLEDLVTHPGEAVVFGLVAIVAGGIREELQRAFLLTRFERYLGGTAVGVGVLSVAFGLGHLLQGFDAAVSTGTLGLFWALVYVRRRSTVAPVVSHAGFNALEVLRAVSMGG
jgi:membrane protease YdiL (CAAX protease family)